MKEEWNECLATSPPTATKQHIPHMLAQLLVTHVQHTACELGRDISHDLGGGRLAAVGGGVGRARRCTRIPSPSGSARGHVVQCCLRRKEFHACMRPDLSRGSMHAWPSHHELLTYAYNMDVHLRVGGAPSWLANKQDIMCATNNCILRGIGDVATSFALARFGAMHATRDGGGQRHKVLPPARVRKAHLWI